MRVRHRPAAVTWEPPIGARAQPLDASPGRRSAGDDQEVRRPASICATGTIPAGACGGPVHHFPFSAVVGADDLTLALALTAVSPDIGGVLVRGEKGTAKSTCRACPDQPAAGGPGGGRLPLLLRPRPPRRGVPGRSAPGARGGQPAGSARGAAGGRDRGPGGRVAAPRPGARRRRHRVRTRTARRRAPRPAVRRRGQPPARPPRRPAARRRRDGTLVASSGTASRSGTPPGSCSSAR